MDDITYPKDQIRCVTHIQINPPKTGCSLLVNFSPSPVASGTVTAMSGAFFVLLKATVGCIGVVKWQTGDDLYKY